MSDDTHTLEKVEEVREEVIEKFGLDEETQEDLITKLADEALDNQKKVSKTIEQKSKYRQQLIDAGLIDPDTYEPIEKQEADAKLEKKPVKDEVKKLNENQESGLTVEQAEDLVFLNMGGTEEQLEVLRTVTRNEGKTLAKAKESPYYKWWVKEQEEKKKSEDAQLGASKSSKTNTKPRKPQTREEHMAAVENWKKA